MNINSYQTAFNEDTELGRILAPLERQFTMGQYGGEGQIIQFPEFKNSAVRGFINGESTDVPPFGHPIWVGKGLKGQLPTEDDFMEFSKRSNHEPMYLVADLRNCTSISRGSEDFRVTSMSDFDLMRLRAVLEYATVMHSIDWQIAGTNFPLMVFTRWLSNAIISRIALPPEEQVRLNAMIAYYYFCMTTNRFHGNDSDLEQETVKRQALLTVAKAAMINAGEAEQYIYELPAMHTIDDFVKVVCEYSLGEMLKQRFDIVFLYNAINNSFFGINNKELSCVALEHPITFISMVATVMKHSSLSRCGIGKAVDSLSKSNGEVAKLFLRSVTDIVRLVQDDSTSNG